MTELLNAEKISKTSSNPKTAARLCVVQAFYSMLIDEQQDKENAISSAFEIMQREKIKVKQKFAENLFNFACAEKESIDFIIKKYLDKNKEADKVNPLLQAILNTSIAELINDKETSRAILLSEYLLITSEFFSGVETGFVNAVLDKFVKESASS